MNNRTLFFAFPSLKAETALENERHVFYLSNKLSIDVPKLLELIIELKPSYIVGFAKARKKQTYIETVAVNIFHEREIDRTSKQDYSLFIPKPLPKSVRKRPYVTTTFCNMVCYKVASFIEENNLNAKFSFYHIGNADKDQSIRDIAKQSF